MALLDVDNFKCYNNAPNTYASADKHLKKLGIKVKAIAKGFGGDSLGDFVIPTHMHGDELLVKFREDKIKKKQIKDFFAEVSGVVEVDDTVTGIAVPGKITLSGGVVRWVTSSIHDNNLKSWEEAKARANNVLDMAKKTKGKACIMYQEYEDDEPEILFQYKE